MENDVKELKLINHYKITLSFNCLELYSLLSERKLSKLLNDIGC